MDQEQQTPIAVLLVEDQAMMALVETKELESYGYQVVHCSTGEEALEEVRTNKTIQVILMDVDLGVGMDGIETAQIILQEKDIPLLFLSGYTNRVIVEKTEKVTSYGYIIKNSGITVIDASIKMALRLFKERQQVNWQRRVLEKKNFETRQLLEEVVAAKKEVLLSREVQHTLIEFSPLPIIAVNRSGQITIWNHAAEEYLGWSSDELMGQPLPLNVVTERNQDEATEELLHHVLNGDTIQFLPIIQNRKDGLPMRMKMSASPIKSLDGSIIGAFVVLYDLRLNFGTSL
jgi:PAS domain S-box-containing protein